MEKLRLPEPARSLWNAKRNIVHSLPDEGTGRTVRPHLGGGTTLAARWGHRRSTDIDILLPGRNTLISRQALIDSRFSTVVCAPVYTMRHGLRTQVDVGPDEGLRHDSSVHCDELVSLRKSQLTQYVGSLGAAKLTLLDTALMAALGIDPAGRKGRWLLHDGDF